MTNKLSAEQLELLKRPLPAEAIKPHPSASHLSTIKVIYVIERLNEVFGVGGWRIQTDLLPLHNGQLIFAEEKEGKKTTYTTLVKTVFEAPDYGIYYECIAGSSNVDPGDAAKGGTSDGIGKIASFLGIGMDVYKGLTDKRPQQNGFAGQPPKPVAPAAKKGVEPTGAQIDAMLKAISEGKWKDVENALPKYTLSAEQKETITKAINDAKTAAIKAAIQPQGSAPAVVDQSKSVKPAATATK